MKHGPCIWKYLTHGHFSSLYFKTLQEQENKMDDDDSNEKCMSTEHGTDINVIKLSYNSPPVSEAVERFKLIRLVFKLLMLWMFMREVEIMKTITREIAGHHWLHFSSDNFDKDEFKFIKNRVKYIPVGTCTNTVHIQTPNTRNERFI